MEGKVQLQELKTEFELKEFLELVEKLKVFVEYDELFECEFEELMKLKELKKQFLEMKEECEELNKYDELEEYEELKKLKKLKGLEE